MPYTQFKVKMEQNSLERAMNESSANDSTDTLEIQQENGNEPSMVIYVHPTNQTNQEETRNQQLPIVSTDGSDISANQVITFIQDFAGSLEPHVIPITLLEPSVDSENNNTFDLAKSTISSTIQTEDGQVLYLTYPLNSIDDTGSDQQQIILHVNEDGNTVTTDLAIPEGDGIDVKVDKDAEPDLLANFVSVNDNIPLKSEDPSSSKEKINSVKVNNSASKIITSEINIEAKLEVLDALVPPVPRRKPRSVFRKKRRKKDSEKDCDPKLYMCDLCGVAFSKAQQYYGHLHAHTGERKWDCQTCHKEFVSHSLLRVHEKIHTNFRPYVCKLCKKRFDRASQLLYHERRIHKGEKDHRCQICYKGFFKRSDLRTHLNIHLGIKKCICETCGKQFNHVSNLIRHRRVHTGIKPYPCNVCGKRFSQVNALQHHKNSHSSSKDVRCRFCSKFFKSFLLLKKHIRHMHSDKIITKEASEIFKSAIQNRRYYCKVCGEDFPFSAELKDHEIQHEKETSLHCNSCGQDYNTVEQFKIHPCETVEERLLKQSKSASLEQQDEHIEVTSQFDVGQQLQTLIQESLQEWGVSGHLMNKGEEIGDGSVSEQTTGEIIIYVTQEGVDQPTEVHIKPVSLFGAQKRANSQGESTGRTRRSSQCSDSSGVDNDDIAGSTDIVQDIANEFVTPETPFFHNSYSDVTKQDPTSTSTNILATDHCIFNSSETGSADVEFVSSSNASKSSESIVPKDCKVVDTFSVLTEANDGSGDYVLQNLHEAVDPLALAEDVKITVNPLLISSTLKEKENETVTVIKQECITDSPELSLKKKARMFKCTECCKTFSKNSNYRQHLGIHFVELQKYHCTECGQSFAWKSTLNKHMLLHSPDPPPRYRCELCSKEYTTLSQVQEHIKRDHYKERPHVCSLCNKQFYKKYDLKIHLRTHTKEKPYMCGTCGKEFYHLSHIIRHERIHTGEKPYRCDDCGRKFNQSSTLKTHRQRHVLAYMQSTVKLCADEAVDQPQVQSQTQYSSFEQSTPLLLYD